MYWFPSKTYSGCKYAKKLEAATSHKHNGGNFNVNTRSYINIFGSPAYALPNFQNSGNLGQTSQVRLDSAVYLCGLVLVDTNGAKAPNRMGFDVFVFDVRTDGISPHSGDDDCKDLTGNGYTCSSKLINEGEHALDFIYE